MGIREWIQRQLPQRVVYVEKAYSVNDFRRDVEEGVGRDVLAGYGNVGDPFQTNAVVYSAVHKKAVNIAGVEWQILNGDTPVTAETPVTRLFANPYPGVSQQEFWESIVSNLELHGKAYVIWADYMKGVPFMMWVADSAFMKEELDKDNRTVKSYTYGEGAQKRTIAPEHVMKLHYWKGLAPITAARLDILQQFHANQYNVNFFKQGALLKGFFKSTAPRPLTPAQESELQRSLEQKGGSGNRTAHTIPVYSGVEYVPVGVSQKDMEFLLLQGYSRDQILMVLQVPKAILGFTDGFNYANMKEIRRDFWNKSLIPIMHLIEQAFEAQFFERFKVPFKGRFNIKGIQELQEDLGEQAVTAKIFYDMGIPFAVINERLGLDFPEFEPEDRTPPALRLPQDDEEDEDEKPPPPDAKAIATEVRKQMVAEKLEGRRRRERALPMDKELRRAEWLQTEKRMKTREDIMVPKIRGFFSTAREQVFAYLKEHPAKAVAKATIDAEWIKRFHDHLMSLGWGDGLFKALESEELATYLAGARRTYWGLGVRFDLPPVRAQAFIHTRGLKLWDATNEVLETITDAMQAGMPADKIGQEIQRVFDGVSANRAKLIARTETTNAYNGGRVEGMKVLGITKKQWINSEDSTVRDSHRIESIVEVDQPFTLANGERVMYPGDGPAAEACNCRCTVGSVIE